MAKPTVEAGREKVFRAVLTQVDRTWANALAEWLGPCGVEIVWARTGLELMEIVESAGVHLAVLELDLPQLDGLGVLRLMQRADIRVPSVLVSDSTGPEVLTAALRWNAFSVVRKPVDSEVLSNTVSRAFRRFYGVTWAYKEW